jgi:diadenosine tetraphosphate (Ap4A) HIT family hydrolase
VSEIIDLDAADQAQLLAEINAASHALKAVATFDKLNVAAIGNVVAQLHVHVIGRRHSDKAWPKPVWGAVPATAYDPAVRDGFIAALRRALSIK